MANMKPRRDFNVQINSKDLNDGSFKFHSQVDALEALRMLDMLKRWGNGKGAWDGRVQTVITERQAKPVANAFEQLAQHINE